MSAESAWSYRNPVRVVSASLDTLFEYIEGTHLLLVTSPGSVTRGLVDRLRRKLGSRTVVVWDRVKANPDIQDLDAATAELKGRCFDGVIGLGGGSVLDAAKVLALTLSNSASPTLVQFFREKGYPEWVVRLPLALVPTTSGTGSEVTPFATAWDHGQYKKYSIAGPVVFPDLALLDTSLTLTLRENDTLYPALDTISHALESLWNKHCMPISRAFAFQALSLSNMALLEVLKSPHSFRHRQNLQTASLFAGLAISQTRTAIAHSISYPLTSHLGMPHGLACSFTLPALIDQSVREICHSEMETVIIANTRSVLKEIAPGARILKKYGQQDIFDLIDEMNLPGRLDNYIQADSVDIESVVKKSLATNC